MMMGLGAESPPRKPIAAGSPHARRIKAKALRSSLSLPSLHPAPSKWDLVRDSESTVNVFARGKVHAQQDVQQIAAWRDEITREFLALPKKLPAVVKHRKRIVLPERAMPLSPDHFGRRYDAVRSPFASARMPALKPLKPLKPFGDPSRAAQCLEARHACWTRNGLTDPLSNADDPTWIAARLRYA
jgi:hypothetical protein